MHIGEPDTKTLGASKKTRRIAFFIIFFLILLLGASYMVKNHPDAFKDVVKNTTAAEKQKAEPPRWSLCHRGDPEKPGNGYYCLAGGHAHVFRKESSIRIEFFYKRRTERMFRKGIMVAQKTDTPEEYCGRWYQKVPDLTGDFCLEFKNRTFATGWTSGNNPDRGAIRKLVLRKK